MRRQLTALAAAATLVGTVTACGTAPSPGEPTRVASTSKTFPAQSEQALRSRIADFHHHVVEHEWAKATAFFTPRCQSQVGVGDLSHQVQRTYGPDSPRNLAAEHEHKITIDGDVAQVSTQLSSQPSASPVKWSLVNSLWGIDQCVVSKPVAPVPAPQAVPTTPRWTPPTEQVYVPPSYSSPDQFPENVDTTPVRPPSETPDPSSPPSSSEPKPDNELGIRSPDNPLHWTPPPLPQFPSLPPPR